MFTFSFLSESHISEMEKLESKMLEKLTRKDLYFGDWDLIKRNLKEERRVIGLSDNDKLIAFHVLDYPIREENLGVDLGFSESDLECVGQIGPICIDPDYQGQGIMAKIIAPHLKISKEARRYHILATVSPYNYGSMKWCLTHGFLIKKITEKYDDMVRAIVHLDMIKENLNIKCENNVIVPNNNIEVQKALLSSGYCGYELRRTDDGFNITYGKIKRMEWMY